MRSVKSAIGEYGNPFLETSSDILVLDTRDIVVENLVFTMCIEWSPMDVNSTTICMHTVHVVMKKNNIH